MVRNWITDPFLLSVLQYEMFFQSAAFPVFIIPLPIKPSMFWQVLMLFMAHWVSAGDFWWRVDFLYGICKWHTAVKSLIQSFTLQFRNISIRIYFNNLTLHLFLAGWEWQPPIWQSGIRRSRSITWLSNVNNGEARVPCCLFLSLFLSLNESIARTLMQNHNKSLWLRNTTGL